MEVTYISSEDAFRPTIESILKLPHDATVALDVETTGLDCFTDQLTLISIAYLNPENTGFVYVYDNRKVPHRLLEYILKLLEPKRLLIFNAKFDLKFILKNFGIRHLNVYDPMVAESVLEAGKGQINKKSGQWVHKALFSLNDLSEPYAGITLHKEQRDAFINNPDVVITPELLEYSAKDVEVLFPILEGQKKKTDARNLQKTIDLEMRLLPAVLDMEYTGITLDIKEWFKLRDKAKEELEKTNDDINNQCYQRALELIQVEKFDGGESLLSYFNIPYKKTKKNLVILTDCKIIEDQWKLFKENFNSGSPLQMRRMLNLFGVHATSTDSRDLKKDFPNNKFVEILLYSRELGKRISTYGNSYVNAIHPVTGRIHTELNQAGTSTGRFASYGPNLQNVIKGSGYRECFIAPEDYYFLKVDYSQIELRLAADKSRDQRMVNAFLEDRDLHFETAVEVLEIAPDQVTELIRRDAKNINFAILYGTSANGLAINFGIPKARGHQIIKKHIEIYPKLHLFINSAQEIIVNRGYSITPFGRKRYFVLPMELMGKDWKFLYQIQREGFNHIIQGGSADMIKIAICNIFYNNPFGDLLKLVLTVHDEILAQAHKSIVQDAKKFIDYEMIAAAKLFLQVVPAKIDSPDELTTTWH